MTNQRIIFIRGRLAFVWPLGIERGLVRITVKAFL